MRGFLFPLALFLLLAGASVYLARRLHQGLASFFPRMRFWPVLTIVCAFVLMLVLSFVRSRIPLPQGAKQILGSFSAYGMGIALYLLLYTCAADVLLLALRLMKLPFTAQGRLRGAVMAGVLVLTLSTCAWGCFNARQIDIAAYQVQMKNKKDISDLTVAMISDLHLGAIGSEARLEDIVAGINDQEPDLVCIAGDFFDTDFSAIQNPDAALKTLREMDAKYGVYACLGNHDGGKTYDQMVGFLEQANIQLLRDEYTVIDGRLILAGRLDASAIGGYGDDQRKPFSEILLREDASLPVIVLDHNPAGIHEYSTEADLILCGHTHQGQVFPGNLITNWIYTVDYGYYRKDAQSPHVIVSSGIGGWGVPMRVGSNSEIVIVRFSQAP